MRRYMHQNIQHATQTWIALAIEILVTAAIYVVLGIYGVPQGITVLISSVSAFVFVLFGLFITYKVIPQSNAPSIRIVGETARDMHSATASQIEEAKVTKALIHQLADAFVDSHMEEQLGAFQALWEQVRMLSLETLEQLRPSLGMAQGLGFAGGNQQLLPIVSTISWTVINWPNLSQTNPPEKITTLIVEEAKARGCRLALSYTLARYLQEHLTVS